MNTYRFDLPHSPIEDALTIASEHRPTAYRPPRVAPIMGMALALITACAEPPPIRTCVERFSEIQAEIGALRAAGFKDAQLIDRIKKHHKAMSVVCGDEPLEIDL